MWWPFKRPQEPPDLRSRDERLGILVRPGAWTVEPGRDWTWVLGQFDGARYWNPDRESYVRVRRKAWPIRYIRAGLKLPTDEGGFEVVKQEMSTPWRIWRESDVGDQRTIIGGLVVGWGGQIGAMFEVDDWVPVCGQRMCDGIMYRPTEEDLRASDWERI